MGDAQAARNVNRQLPFRRAALCILLPFASGYYLSYLFRTVGALVSDRLIVELHLTPGSLVLGCPRVLVLDEPSLGLARIVVAGIYRTLARLREEGLTIPLIEQAATTAIAFADRTAVLVGGRVVLQGGRDELLASGAVVRHYLGITDAA